VIDIAEKDPKMGTEAPKRDRDLPALQTPAMGVRAMERRGYQGLQSPRSLSEAAYEAGHKDGYGDGYVDGYDDGQYNQLIGLIKELEDWVTSPIIETDDIDGVYAVFFMLRERLEHGP